MTPDQLAWLDDFRRESAAEIPEPFLLCLAAAIAAVESGWGARAIRHDGMLNEIGYKALPGHPAVARPTREAAPDGALIATQARFRLFADRASQARALVYLLRTSRHYEASRLLMLLAFYAAYAPGRRAGARQLVRVFDRLAALDMFPGARPFGLLSPTATPASRALNHAAARDAVRLFAELTGA